MDASIPEALNIQTFMIVWDINLKIANKVDRLEISTPLFSLNPNKCENKNWIGLRKFEEKIWIHSSFSSTSELKGCTTYMINPLKSAVLDVFKEFAVFAWNQHEWSEKMRFVFKLEIQCDTKAVQPIIWKHFITETMPAIYTKGLYLTLDAEKATHTVLNNRGLSCVVKRNLNANMHFLGIVPKTPLENWNLFTVMLKKTKNNAFEWYYLQTDLSFTGVQKSIFLPLIIFEIFELKTALEDISDSEMAAITNVIKPNLTPSAASNEQQQLIIASNLTEYFRTNKLCDITVQVGDQQVRAHKVILATGSSTWRHLCFEDETLAAIVIDDFDIGTIKQMIEYMYTGTVKQPIEAPDQLLSAANKYGVAGLKKLCEEQLMETIDMENVVNLFVLADRCNADVLFNKVLQFVRVNYAEFNKLEDAKSLFVMHPELAFKLFAKII